MNRHRRLGALPLRLFEMRRSTVAAEAQKRFTYSKLPKLMPPDLTKTLATFLEFAKPIQSQTEFEKTKQLTKQFVDSGEATFLHQSLVERANKLNNWLTPWWVDIAYLQARTPLPIVTSPGIAFPPLEYSGEEGQIDAAAKIIQAVLGFHHKILEDRLPEDRAGQVPFDMSQYKFLFGTTRVPKRGQDKIVYGCSRDNFSRHILVTKNGHTFKVPVYTKEGEVLGVEALIAQLRDHVVPKCRVRIPRPVNLMSSGDRDAWADVYAKLKERNPESIRAYEEALFVVSLDEQAEQRDDRNLLETQMRQMLHGGGASENGVNRWFDKTIQINMGLDGYSGLTYEHTPAEGPPVAVLMDHVCSQLEAKNFYKDSDAAAELPVELQFTTELADEDAIEKAAEQFDVAANNLEVRFLPFEEFGKNVPKRAKLSPDSFIQMAFQVTHYRMHRVLPPTYETATLRKFDEGRTDTIRLPSPASAAFTKAFVDERENRSPRQLAELMRTAVNAHKDYSVRAMMGHGIDRHLLGLRLTATEQRRAAPALFDGQAYRRMNHFRVSTSQVPTRFVIPMGFGPSAADCYGICYNPQETALYFTLTAYKSCRGISALAFAEQLTQTLRDFRDLLESAGDLSQKAKL